MELDLNVLRPQERASLQLRLLYEQEGFRKYHGSRNTVSIRRTAVFFPASRSSPLRTWTGGCWR